MKFDIRNVHYAIDIFENLDNKKIDNEVNIPANYQEDLSEKINEKFRI